MDNGECSQIYDLTSRSVITFYGNSRHLWPLAQIVILLISVVTTFSTDCNRARHSREIHGARVMAQLISNLLLSLSCV